MALSPFFHLDRDPLAVFRRLQEDIGRGIAAPARAGGFPAVNLWQGPDSFALTAELPGVDPGAVDIQVKEDVLTISGERRPPETGEDSVWHRRERAFGRFSRVVQLPYRVDPERIEARMSDGVLQIELHRPEADKPRRIQIKPN